MALQEVETRVSPVVNGRLRETVRGRSGEAAARSEGACTAPGHRNEPEGRAGRAALRDATRGGGGASSADLRVEVGDLTKQNAAQLTDRLW